MWLLFAAQTSCVQVFACVRVFLGIPVVFLGSGASPASEEQLQRVKLVAADRTGAAADCPDSCGCACFGGGSGQTRLSRTRTTSCIVGRSDGCLLLQRSANWKTFLTSPRSLHVSVMSGSTISMTVLSAALDRICR